MIRMLNIGYVFVIRSERQLCSDVQVNLAYRWFCRLNLEGTVPDHSVFLRAHHERFRESNLFRQVFEKVVGACIREELVGGQSLTVSCHISPPEHFLYDGQVDGLFDRLRPYRALFLEGAPEGAWRGRLPI